MQARSTADSAEKEQGGAQDGPDRVESTPSLKLTPLNDQTVRKATKKKPAGACVKGSGGAGGKLTVTKEFVKKLMDLDAVVEFSQTNPKSAGSKSHALYEAYKTARSLNAMLRLGGRRGDIYNDMQRGYLRPVDPNLFAELTGKEPDSEAGGVPGIL